MSAAFCFRIKTEKDNRQIIGDLNRLVAAQFSVDLQVRESGIELYLDYALHDPNEESAVKKVIQYLQENATDGVVYIPCQEAYDETTELSQEVITFEEIFGKFYPSLSTQKNRMYRIKEI